MVLTRYLFWKDWNLLSRFSAALNNVPSLLPLSWLPAVKCLITPFPTTKGPSVEPGVFFYIKTIFCINALGLSIKGKYYR